jgi:hypothetical protein
MTNRTTQLGQRCRRFTNSGFFPGIPGAIKGRVWYWAGIGVQSI